MFLAYIKIYIYYEMAKLSTEKQKNSLLAKKKSFIGSAPELSEDKE